MLATYATRTLEAASTLPEFAQLAIYEFAFGSHTYRHHKVRLTLAHKEMTFRLSNKIALEENVIKLDGFLASLCIIDAIHTYTWRGLDLGQHAATRAATRAATQADPAHPRAFPYVRVFPFLRAFPTTRSSVVFTIDWGNHVPGPRTITIIWDYIHGSVFMTTKYFPPTNVERALMRRSGSTAIRTHTTLDLLVADLIAANAQ
jgi:hypothetical protein